MTTAPKQPHRVVIVGAGFGGLEATFVWPARRSRSRWSTAATITCSSRCSTSRDRLAGDFRDRLADPVSLRDRPDVTTLFANVNGVDAAGKRALLDDGDALPYDTLILATGARHAYFGHDEWEPFAPG